MFSEQMRYILYFDQYQCRFGGCTQPTGRPGFAARFWPKKASIAVYHHSAYCMLPLLLVCCVCLCRRVWSAVLLCCRVVCCVKGKRRVSTEMGRHYLPRGQGMFCLDDAKRLDSLTSTDIFGSSSSSSSSSSGSSSRGKV